VRDQQQQLLPPAATLHQGDHKPRRRRAQRSLRRWPSARRGSIWLECDQRNTPQPGRPPQLTDATSRVLARTKKIRPCDHPGGSQARGGCRDRGLESLTTCKLAFAPGSRRSQSRPRARCDCSWVSDRAGVLGAQRRRQRPGARGVICCFWRRTTAPASALTAPARKRLHEAIRRPSPSTHCRQTPIPSRSRAGRNRVGAVASMTAAAGPPCHPSWICERCDRFSASKHLQISSAASSASGSPSDSPMVLAFPELLGFESKPSLLGRDRRAL